MRRHTVFRDNEYTHTVVFPDSYQLPATNRINMQVRYNGRILADITPDISVTGKRVTYTYTPEMLAKVPSIVQQYLVLDGKSFIGGELGVLVGYGEQDISETHVTIVDGEVTVVEVMGLALVEAQVSIATEKAAQTTEDALQTAADRIQTSQDAATTTTKAAEAAGSATASNNAKVAAEAARDQVIGPLATKMDLYKTATYASMQAFIASEEPGECAFRVRADETNGGSRALYFYDPAEEEPLEEFFLL